ncbi:30S ribosomal protein S4 [Mycoplasma sp. 744]|uniref:30S ribosomal protein S4 n=1 Tax=unclassified Mycoplasma TaxID=2683645 RepID=UPI00211CD3B0|nr:MULTISPECIES: 30S ribosomal protein S4 [unclassified Mycoplasma]MEA4115620.1 30S ribosomal protein S4 [Mycoplasma sp. 744]UUM19168.1 30S ribosomal protein S4 [Mycoplasma sp. 1018B]
MSRYTGPVFKKSRRYGFSILETGKEFSKGRKRNYAPGQHGNKRVKLSDYGLHLYEKQKVKFLYGISEKQMQKYYKNAIKIKGVAGTNLLQLLESRLDNLVYRAGFASTRRQARQLVNHGHFEVDGHKANIPSMKINLNSVITLKEKSHKNAEIQKALETRVASQWLTVNKDKFTIKYDRMPERNELHTEIKENYIIEFYSK